MRESFDIAVSRSLTREQFLAALARLIPSRASEDEVWITATSDPSWPCMITCVSRTAASELGPYPDLRIASELFKCFGVDSLCDVYEFAGPFGQHDPYWWLVCIGGRWYLADAVDAPVITGNEGGEGVKLIRPVEIPGDPSAT